MARSVVPPARMGMARELVHLARNHWQEAVACDQGTQCALHESDQALTSTIHSVWSYDVVSTRLCAWRCVEHSPDDDCQSRRIRPWHRWRAVYAPATNGDVAKYVSRYDLWQDGADRLYPALRYGFHGFRL